MPKALKIILNIIIFFVCMALVIIGQKHIGIQGFCTMLIGLAGLLGLLYQYNKKYV